MVLTDHGEQMKKILLMTVFMIACLGGFSVLASDEFASEAKFSFAMGDSSSGDLKTQSAFVVLTNELFNGKTNALEIFFFDRPLTAEDKADIENNKGQSLREKYRAVMVLFIDKDNKIWQVNATCVIPGKTVAYTVAWKPQDLKQFFSDYAFDGKTLKLKSVGQYKDVDSQKNPIQLDWDVHVDMTAIEDMRP